MRGRGNKDGIWMTMNRLLEEVRLAMRLDRFLCEMNIGTRSQVKTYVRQGLVTINGAVAKDAGLKVDEQSDKVFFRSQELKYRKFVYYMLNKPEGVVSATTDKRDTAVTALLGEDCREDIFPVGRLDKDVTGLLLLTNDGDLAHRLLSPRRHVDKVYQVDIARPLDAENIERLEQGLDIGEEQPTLPARVEVLDAGRILLTLHEGRFHQVKRMLQAVGNEVLKLKRIAFGGLELDEGLALGEYRELREEEVEALRSAT